MTVATTGAQRMEKGCLPRIFLVADTVCPALELRMPHPPQSGGGGMKNVTFLVF